MWIKVKNQMVNLAACVNIRPSKNLVEIDGKDCVEHTLVFEHNSMSYDGRECVYNNTVITFESEEHRDKIQQIIETQLKVTVL